MKNPKLKFALAALLLVLCVGPTLALSLRAAHRIDNRVDETLANFQSNVRGATGLLHRARAVLVFPGVVKAGFIFGGEHGTGELRVNGRTVGYYSITSGSWGAQFGAQEKDIIFAFMTDAALQQLRSTDGFKVGVDGAVTVIKAGVGGSIDSNTITEPVVAIVRNQKGLMLDLSLKGTKISRMKVKD